MELFQSDAVIGRVEDAIVEERSDVMIEFGTQSFFHVSRATIKGSDGEGRVVRAKRRG